MMVGFLDFLNNMRGRYEHASFKGKRHALDVLGVKVFICPDTQEVPVMAPVETDQEWLTIPDVARMTGMNLSTIRHHLTHGNLHSEKKSIPQLAIHREALTESKAVKNCSGVQLSFG